MESSRTNPKPLTREHDLPKKVMLGRTLLAIAAVLAIGLVAGPRSLAPISAIVAATIAFPVLIELRTLARGDTGSLDEEPWGIDAVSLLTASACILGMASVSLFTAWAMTWLEVGV